MKKKVFNRPVSACVAVYEMYDQINAITDKGGSGALGLHPMRFRRSWTVKRAILKNNQR